jgi:hypothetical protein
MDVYGKAPVSEVGKYLRHSVWTWHPLAEYCEKVAPELTTDCQHWHTNDGDGLDATGATLLANALQIEVDTGRCAKYAAQRKAEQEALPSEPCFCCGGTGLRKPPPVVGPGDRPCNGCGTTGKVRPHQTHYPFEVAYVVEFIAFLRECGGFEIY